ncbi:hypothetical protein BABINDRAFT_44431 [Babjeviella inositovora NRRL Y-12698]|uniref:ATP-dependent RNA helicase DBP10 n=1 Tax=Babjeviella inositovora NRRL Y-12698 TaxID=984486 RepID=A0A1E3QZG2_9ASCO|nr:uncharacterized protein BABINDRAFT_44431 [Babjeviella inositovora NRRL Y-12698]ODQ83060.1 hypothetical protein BABINDRAFT_44431 [Babjeviella inositovora NRRL Y-12698]
MSDNEEYDIASNIALDISGSSDESDIASDGEFQDEIMSSDDEEQPKKKQKVAKVAKVTKTAFPSLELSDNEGQDEEILSYFTSQTPLAKKAKNGSFASFGLSKFILQNIGKKGFKQPTPIQRKTIPLILQNRDVVGMARTGSGKTAAFVLPVIEKLKAHSAKIGVRAVILSPSRELANQTYKQVKEFSRGTDLRPIVLMGGDSLDDQFSSMTNNPDIVVATPGRFLHLKTEMQLDLKAVEYIVFDEADRLFEMGFSEQLNELLAALPPNRQSLLFSATLPTSLIDFAKAGLTNPVLVRLDAETKISENLEMAYFTTKRNEREANLLFTLQEVIHLPLATEEQLVKLRAMSKHKDSSDEESDEEQTKKRKKKLRPRLPPANQLPSPHSTIVFVPTKHHVEYITKMLKAVGYAVSYIYGALDQYARKQQLLNFRTGLTNVLVVTDVAARGIDIPVLANVVNYSLPASSKIFIHRVGRTARAGNKGWAYSLISEKELPYLLDLELFLGRKLLLTAMFDKKCELIKQKCEEELAVYLKPKVSYIDRLVIGSAPRTVLEDYQETYDNLIKNNYEVSTLKDVAVKGEKLYFRTRSSASPESMKRSKEIINAAWDDQHLLFGANLEKEKEAFLAKLSNRYSKETVFEFGKNDDSMVALMNKRRRQIAPIQRRAKEKRELLEMERMAGFTHGLEDEILKGDSNEVGYTVSNEQELTEAFEDGDAALKKSTKTKKSFRDPNFFISHYAPTNVIQDQQLAVNNGGERYKPSFVNEAANAAFDLDNDDKIRGRPNQVMKWDTKKKKYINQQSTDQKYIIGESGQKIPATYRSGRYENWKHARGVGDMKVGSQEKPTVRGNKFVHKKVSAPKLPDKFRDDYHTQKKKVEKAVESGVHVKGWNKKGQASNEIKSTEQIRRERAIKEQKQAKNARPAKGGKKRKF